MSDKPLETTTQETTPAKATTDSKSNRDPKGHIISKKAVKGIIKKYFKGNDAGFDPEFEKKFKITEQCAANCVMLKNKGDMLKGETGDKIVPLLDLLGKPVYKNDEDKKKKIPMPLIEIDGKPVTYSEYNEALIRSALIKLLSHPDYRLKFHDISFLDAISKSTSKLGIPNLGIRSTMGSMFTRKNKNETSDEQPQKKSNMREKFGSMFTRKNKNPTPSEGDKDVEMTEVQNPLQKGQEEIKGGRKSRKHKKHAKKYTKKQQKYKKPKKNTKKPKNKTHKKPKIKT